jgi:hypothetical protein
VYTVQGGIKDNEKNALTEAMKDEEMEEIDQKDDGYIELVLACSCRMCDGQHRGLQDYLREQPDNMKSFNIIAETAQFLNLVYSNVNGQTIDLVVQLFESINEFSVVSFKAYCLSKLVFVIKRIKVQ